MPELGLHSGWIKAGSLVCGALLARALLDKALASQSGPLLVALWAQYQSIVELVAGVTLVGLGQGLTVFAARNEHTFGMLLRAGAVWGLALSAGLGALILLLAFLWGGTGDLLQGHTVLLAVLTGWISVLPGLFLAFWQGRQQRGRMIAVLVLSWLPLLAAGAGTFGTPDIAGLLRLQLATQSLLLVVLLASHWRALWQGGSWRGSPLPRYLWAGLSVGILSPLSLLWLRAELAVHLSWDDVARLQALWRLTEWVTGIVAAILSLLYLPVLARQREDSRLFRQMGEVWRVVFRPAAVVLLLAFLAYRPIMLLLYDARFLMPRPAVALFMLGDVLRIASWIPLFGMYARERVLPIAIGEWLSLPLFALLITLVRPADLQVTALLYVLSYLLYFLFNQTAMRNSGNTGALDRSAT